MQIRRHAEAARGMADRRLHHIGQREGAKARQRLAPALQIAGRGHRGRTQRVLPPDRVHRAGRGVGIGRVGGRAGGERRGALAVDHHMAAVGQPDMRHAAAQDADHHRLDHGQREESRDRRVDRVAAGGQHLRAGGRGERMVGDHHAARAGRRLLLAAEMSCPRGCASRSRAWPVLSCDDPGDQDALAAPTRQSAPSCDWPGGPGWVLTPTPLRASSESR